MSNPEIRITSIQDFLLLDEAQFDRMLPDFKAWHKFALHAKSFDAEVVNFIWVDDGNPGEISGINVRNKETGETFSYKVEDDAQT